MGELPLKGWPYQVLDELESIVRGIANHYNVAEFYIGRTNDIVTTKSRHGCEQIITIYETDSLINAEEVEDTLINEFLNHSKNSNDQEHSGGGTSKGYINFVYVALWYKT